VGFFFSSLSGWKMKNHPFPFPLAKNKAIYMLDQHPEKKKHRVEGQFGAQ